MGLEDVELFIAFEEEFDISIPDAEAEYLTTPREVTEYVWGKVGHRQMTREQVAARVRRVVARQAGSEDFTDDSRFVRDIRLYR